MAYVGQGIKGGTFSVLDTSGNTYNGSNVTFNLGTQVGSPAQLLVSHDGVIQKPVTDYTIATGGTQITFTTAPASGASIFITEISGAVGAPMNRDINGDELILDADADTSITADTDDQIDIRIAGADDFQFTANTFTAAAGSSISSPNYSGGAVFNEDSADVDFRVESNGNTHMLFVDGGNDKVGIGESGAAPLGTLHVHAGNSTATSVQSNSTALVVEGAANAGIQLLSTNDEYNTINFGDPEDPNIGSIQYYHTNNSMHFVTSTTEVLRLNAGSSAEVNPSAAAHGGTSMFVYGASGQTVIQVKHADTSGSDTLILFKDGANTNCGSITIDTSNNTVAYATSSDYRLKENETAITDGITRLKQLKPYRFNWKSNSGGNKEDGFFCTRSTINSTRSNIWNKR